MKERKKKINIYQVSSQFSFSFFIIFLFYLDFLRPYFEGEKNLQQNASLIFLDFTG